MVRDVSPEVPPRVEYELTALGLGLLEPMERLVQWIGDNGERPPSQHPRPHRQDAAG